MKKTELLLHMMAITCTIGTARAQALSANTINFTNYNNQPQGAWLSFMDPDGDIYLPRLQLYGSGAVQIQADYLVHIDAGGTGLELTDSGAYMWGNQVGFLSDTLSLGSFWNTNQSNNTRIVINRFNGNIDADMNFYAKGSGRVITNSPATFNAAVAFTAPPSVGGSLLITQSTLSSALSGYVSSAGGNIDFLKIPGGSGDPNDGKIANNAFAPGLNIVGIVSGADTIYRKIALWGEINQQQNDGTNRFAGSTIFNGNIYWGNGASGGVGRGLLSLNSGWNAGAFPTFGSDGPTSLVMLHNPHLPFRGDNVAPGFPGRASIRAAIDANATTWWDFGLAGDFFHVYRNGSGEFLRVTNGGNVGIGTANPTERLEVSGNIKTSGVVTAGFVRAASSEGSAAFIGSQVGPTFQNYAAVYTATTDNPSPGSHNYFFKGLKAGNETISIDSDGSVKTSGTVTAGKVRVPESGDLSMGSFTAHPPGLPALSPLSLSP